MFSTVKAQFVTRLTSLGYTEQVEFFENENIANLNKTYSVRCAGIDNATIESKHNLVFLKLKIDVSINYDLHLGNSYASSIDLLDDIIVDLINPTNYASGVRVIEYDGIDLNINNDTLEAKLKFAIEYSKGN